MDISEPQVKIKEEKETPWYKEYTIVVKIGLDKSGEIVFNFHKGYLSKKFSYKQFSTVEDKKVAIAVE